jgi:hypothetical protein
MLSGLINQENQIAFNHKVTFTKDNSDKLVTPALTICGQRFRRSRLAVIVQNTMCLMI